ncbi:bifunctional folylpolyglutamate synthase/dihydrofolate synthase [Oribacterium sp. WCC10]|uniref:bifunctional folylpolyglutamate synthase/dihydrofolate synthase n=1 Tax=Oribacterium sp. WCC10 TaxID=1855343 RepID=UPI0008E26ED2|nr:folylpolyglutamate synthase/dihydrofolate synthase family protein [Oribacterium sp. WCC10]SFG74607.1 dihydrofolate synthase / folylpolyglutamate synthase [Oribacterium sp. WCC10]
MDWNEAISLLHGADWKHAKIGLERMKDLMHALGDPQEKLRFIHIAGTNGKGSTCSMLRSILTEAGFKTGLYISPHLDAFNERISMDGLDISDEDLRLMAARVREAALKLKEEPTDFELITAMALSWFKENNCDLVVLEVGMGGRLDATNVIPSPIVAAIMSIGLDHTEVLGDTFEKIASEKAGIIKPGADLVVLDQTESVIDVITETFNTVNHKKADLCDKESTPAKLVITSPAELKLHSRSLKGQCFDYRDFKDLRLPLLGAYQLGNVSAVLDIISCLNLRGIPVSDEAVHIGLAKSKWPGRFELLSEDPVLIIDGAHNPDGVEALVDSINAFLPDQKICFVMGVMKDKDYHEMLKLITPFAESFITELPYAARGLDAETLKKEVASYFEGSVETAASVTDAVTKALAHAKEIGVPVICFGSLYQVAEVSRLMTTIQADNK